MYAKWTLYVGKQNQRGIYTVRIFLLVYLQKSLSFCISTNELCSEAAYDFKLNFNFWLHTRKTLTSKISTAWADTCDLPSSISSIDSEMMLLFLYRDHICMENCEHFIVGNRIRFFYMKFRKKKLLQSRVPLVFNVDSSSFTFVCSTKNEKLNATVCAKKKIIPPYIKFATKYLLLRLNYPNIVAINEFRPCNRQAMVQQTN